MTVKIVTAAVLMLVTCPVPGHAESEGKGGAKVDKPVSLNISGARCESGDGEVGANFANVVSFVISPRMVSPDSRFTGPGSYHALIVVHPAKRVSVDGLGTVIVNPDRKSGTFKLDDGRASGSWDCDTPLQ